MSAKELYEKKIVSIVQPFYLSVLCLLQRIAVGLKTNREIYLLINRHRNITSQSDNMTAIKSWTEF